MSEEGIRWDETDGVLTVTFARDEKLNAVSDAMIAVLRESAAALAERDELRVLVITGEGRYFTAGRDVGTMGAGRGVGADGVFRGTSLRRDYRRLHLLFDSFEAIEKPVVLAANGPCLGIGVEMACSCDFRLAAERATFGLPEVPNLAVIPGSGGISRLTRLVGPHWARWMAMAGRNVSAERALTMGFVHEILPDEGFAEEVAAFAASLAALSVEALGLAKLSIDAAASADRASARDFDRMANTLLLSSQDHLDKVAAFRERSAKRRERGK